MYNCVISDNKQIIYHREIIKPFKFVIILEHLSFLFLGLTILFNKSSLKKINAAKYIFLQKQHLNDSSNQHISSWLMIMCKLLWNVHIENASVLQKENLLDQYSLASFLLIVRCLLICCDAIKKY